MPINQLRLQLGMLSVRRPSAEAIRRFLADQHGQPWSYAEVGATAASPPPGYVFDRTRVCLGHGEPVFLAARQALVAWRQFKLGWLEAAPAETSIRPDQVVAVVARAAGLWWLNACRIAYVIDEPPARFGFAYGTLPAHAGRGEERFLVEWNPTTNEVWYEVCAFSRPAHLLARLGYPLVRVTQRRFGRQSGQAMRQAVAESERTSITLIS